MSPKELLYIEDALGHEKFFMSQCQDAEKNLQDSELKQYTRQMCSRHQDLFNKLYNLI